MIPNQSLNVFPGTEVVVPGDLKGIPLLQKPKSQVPSEPEPNVGDHATSEENEIPKESGVGSGDATTDTNEIPEGQGSGGMMPSNGDPDNPDDLTMGFLRILMILIMERILLTLMTRRQKLKHSDSS